MTVAPLFVYGTLRPGLPLWPAIRPGVIGKARIAYAPGYRLYESRWGNYPYMVKVDSTANTAPRQPEDRIVRGTLMNVDTDDPGVQSIIDMELKAGYDLEAIGVFTGTPDKRSPLAVAMCFTYPDRLLVPREPIVEWEDWPSGDPLRPWMVFDWAAEVARKRELYSADEIESLPRQDTK